MHCIISDLLIIWLAFENLSNNPPADNLVIWESFAFTHVYLFKLFKKKSNYYKLLIIAHMHVVILLTHIKVQSLSTSVLSVWWLMSSDRQFRTDSSVHLHRSESTTRILSFFFYLVRFGSNHYDLRCICYDAGMFSITKCPLLEIYQQTEFRSNTPAWNIQMLLKPLINWIRCAGLNSSTGSPEPGLGTVLGFILDIWTVCIMGNK